MNQMMQIQNQEIQVKEYNGRRVVTFKDIARVHEIDFENVKRNFNRNKQHFVEGLDFYSIRRKEFRDILSPNEKLIGNPNVKMILLTESGYLVAVKSLTDDLAWKVQRQLVNCYFKVKEEQETVTVIEQPAVPSKEIIRIGEAIASSSQYNLLAVLDVFRNYISPDVLERYMKPDETTHKTATKLNMTVSSDFATRLMNLIQESGLSQNQFAEKIGLPKSSLSVYCNGKTVPGKDRIKKIAERMKVSIDYFYE